MSPVRRLVVAIGVAVVVLVPACAIDYTVGTGESDASDGSSDTCPDGHVQCGDRCVDLDSDPLNCGECEHPCESDELCLASECREARESECASCPCEACEGDLCCPDLVDSVVVCVADGSCEGDDAIDEP